MGTVQSTSFRNSYIYPHSMFLFGKMLRINSDYFYIRQAGVCNGDEMFFCKLGTDLRLVFERVQPFGL